MFFQSLNTKVWVPSLIAMFLVWSVGISAEDEIIEPTVIALFGDSITLGHNLSHPLAAGPPGGNGSTNTVFVPNLFLKNLLDAEPKRSNVVVNWGQGGSSSTSGTERIIANLNSTKLSHSGKDHIVLILYGTNDLAFGISTSTTGFNIGLMIDRARLVGFNPIVGTLTPRSDFDVSSYNIKIINSAASKGVVVVNHFSRFINHQPGGWPALIDPEGGGLRLHPNDLGYSVIAQAWFDLGLAAIIDPDPIPDPIIVLPWLIFLLDD